MIDNLYPESVEESGNFLRLTLKNIADNKLPYNPIAYSLWYDYATGRNEQLKKDIEIYQKTNHTIGYERVTALFRKHIADNQLLLAEKKTKEFQNILLEMVKQMAESGSKIHCQGDALSTLATQLRQATSMETVGDIANHIVMQTRSLIESSKGLSNQIDVKAKEIETLREELEGIKKTAKTDILTGLLNRRGFDEAMAMILENTNLSDTPLSIIMLDVDRFKQVNDNYGHLIGDNVLKMLSKIIKANIKGKDIAARYGGDEFILGLPETPVDGAYILAEKFRNSLWKMNWKIKNSGESIGHISISLGVTLYKKGQSLEETIQAADQALYRSKNSGRNKTHITD